MDRGIFDQIDQAIANVTTVIGELNLVYQSYIDCRDIMAKLMADEATLNDDQVDSLLVRMIENYLTSLKGLDIVGEFEETIEGVMTAMTEFCDEWPTLHHHFRPEEQVYIEVSCH